MAIEAAFETVWRTTLPGETITLPLYATGGYSAVVDWGDGSQSSITAYNDPDRVHAYASPGDHAVTIRGTVPGWSFNDAGDKLKILKFNSYHAVNPVYFRGGLYGCLNLTEFFANLADASDLSYAWDRCSSVTSFPLIDVSSGYNFTFSWYKCSGLTSFPPLDMSAGTVFYATWGDCGGMVSFPLLDLSAGTRFEYAWQNCVNLTAFPAINFNSSTTFFQTWWGCSKLATFPANMFDSCIATNFNGAFSGCALTQQSVDNILVSINAAGTSNGTLTISGGTSSAPSAAGLAAKSSLQARGWTVATN